MKEFKIKLEKDEIDILLQINFDTSTVEDAILAGIINQIKSQKTIDTE